MKICLTHPKIGSAIHRMAVDLANANPHHEYELVEVHPKRPDQSQLDRFLAMYDWCDVWDAQYWKTAEMLWERFGDRLKAKPSILTHHNPYDLSIKDWGKYTVVVAMNETQKKILKTNYPAVQLIPHAIDLDKWAWNPGEYTERNTVLMVAQRIEGKKGILPVAKACRELGYNFQLVGQVSDMEYARQVLNEGGTFYENISDGQLLELYHQAAVLVCNSVDNFESGTLPILEALATGVPVLTRKVGFIPETYNEENLALLDGEPEDLEELKGALQALMTDRERRLKLREEGYRTVRTRDARRRARQYSQLYYSLVFKEPLVSVVMPVFGHPERLQDQLKSLDGQTYPALELVIVSDGDDSYDELVLESKHTLKYARVGERDKYGLGLARDWGVMEAEGEIIVFLDSRFIPDPKMVAEFVRHLHKKKWLFANKNGKKTFVENVSCMYREEFITMGMSNQLIDGYGGMSQELRARSREQGFKHVYVESAKAEAAYASHNQSGRKDEIREMKHRLWKLGLQ